MRESYRRGVNRAGRATTAARWTHRNGDEGRRVNRVCATLVGRGFAEQTFWHRFQTTKITINRITTKITPVPTGNDNNKRNLDGGSNMASQTTKKRLAAAC